MVLEASNIASVGDQTRILQQNDVVGTVSMTDVGNKQLSTHFTYLVDVSGSTNAGVLDQEIDAIKALNTAISDSANVIDVALVAFDDEPTIMLNLTSPSGMLCPTFALGRNLCNLCSDIAHHNCFHSMERP